MSNKTQVEELRTQAVTRRKNNIARNLSATAKEQWDVFEKSDSLHAGEEICKAVQRSIEEGVSAAVCEFEGKYGECPALECDRCGHEIATDEDKQFGGEHFCESCFPVIMEISRGKCWFDIDPDAADLWVSEGPLGYPTETIRNFNTDSLPEKFRWVEDDEYQYRVGTMPRVQMFPNRKVSYHNFPMITSTERSFLLSKKINKETSQ